MKFYSVWLAQALEFDRRGIRARKKSNETIGGPRNRREDGSAGNCPRLVSGWCKPRFYSLLAKDQRGRYQSLMDGTKDTHTETRTKSEQPEADDASLDQPDRAVAKAKRKEALTEQQDARANRLAAALRDNLKKRKAQARVRVKPPFAESDDNES